MTARDLALISEALDLYESAIGRIGADLYALNGGNPDANIVDLKRRVVSLKFEIDEQRMTLFAQERAEINRKARGK